MDIKLLFYNVTYYFENKKIDPSLYSIQGQGNYAYINNSILYLFDNNMDCVSHYQENIIQKELV